MTELKYFFLFLGLLIISCTPKTVEKIPQETKQENKEVQLSEEEKLCRTFDQLGKRKQEALESFVLYKTNLKGGDYDLAYSYWQKAFRLAPKADGKKTYHYTDGIKIFGYYYEQATDENEKKMWADSAKMLYQRRAMCYGSNAENAATEGFNMYYTFNDAVDNQYIFDRFAEAADELGKEIPYYTINPFSKVIVDMMREETIEMEKASKYAMILLDALEYGNANCGDNCEPWEIINGYAPDRLEVLEGYKNFYPCAYYYEKYYPEFEANPTDCDIIEKVGIRLRRGGCDINSEALQTVTSAFKANCRTEVVTSKGPLSEAYSFYREGDYNAAISKFDEYLASETDTEKLAKTNLTVAKIYYRDIKNYPKARQHALDAAKQKSNWGAPYILIGKLYASSGPICGPGTGWDSQIVTWPAIDKWQYAKKIDSSVSSEANNLINTYQKYMPSIEDVFSRPNVKEGGSFYVGCWIQENTTVRIAK